MSVFRHQSCTVMYWKIKTSVCELLANVDIQLVSCYRCKSSYRKVSQKQYVTRRTENTNKNPTTATCNLSVILLSVYLISSILFVRHPFSKAEAQNTSAQGRDSKSRKVESNKGTLASELRFGLLSDAVWAGLVFSQNVFQSKKGS